MRAFSTAAVLSLTTEVLLCEFQEMADLCEYLLGEPIFTHSYANRKLVEHLQSEVLRQHPLLEVVDVEGIGKDNWQAFLATQVEVFGPTLEIEAMR